MSGKKQIENSFFEILSYIGSFFVGIFRSVGYFFTTKQKKKNKLFDLFDFIFRQWGRYFWSNPSLYKVGSFWGDILSYLFKRK